MSERWLLANRAFFVRDLVRDYCMVFRLLSDQRRRFERDGTVSYSALRDLLGEAMRKGVFWRLKDTAHHLFRNTVRTAAVATEAPAESLGIMLWQYAASPHPDGTAVQSPVEALIDWCVGYAFHECAKLKEDAFQGQHYANRLAQLGRHPAVTGEFYGPLSALAAQTAESSVRELERIIHVLSHGLFLLTRYLTAEGRNCRLARWLACEEPLAREVFGPLYPDLLTALYDGEPERLYLLAARDFLESGRHEPAMALLRRARERNLLNDESRELLRGLESGSAGEADTALCAACAQNGLPRCLAESEPAA